MRKSEQYRLTMTPAMKARLEAEAEERGVSKAEIIREGMRKQITEERKTPKDRLADVRDELEEKREEKIELEAKVEELEEEMEELRRKESVLSEKAQMDSMGATYDMVLRNEVKKQMADKNVSAILMSSLERIENDTAITVPQIAQDIISVLTMAAEDIGTVTVEKTEYVYSDDVSRTGEKTVEEDRDVTEIDFSEYVGHSQDYYSSGVPQKETVDRVVEYSVENWDR
ncbi:MAG: ribbon-helix-helix protein, CopG family, partial [Candidatus Aenigmatarchaeota archaeon]